MTVYRPVDSIGGSKNWCFLVKISWETTLLPSQIWWKIDFLGKQREIPSFNDGKIAVLGKQRKKWPFSLEKGVRPVFSRPKNWIFLGNNGVFWLKMGGTYGTGRRTVLDFLDSVVRPELNWLNGKVNWPEALFGQNLIGQKRYSAWI